MSDPSIAANPQSQPLPEQPSRGRPVGLRLWPGVLLLAVLWLTRTWATSGEFVPIKFLVGILIVPLGVLLGLLLWWLFASRLRWPDRWLVVGAFVVATAATMLLVHPTFRGPAMLFYVLPAVMTAWIGWLLVSYYLPWPVRRAGVLLAFLATGITCMLLRADGVTGEFVAKFSWRWNPTPEQQLLAQLAAEHGEQPSIAQGAGELREQAGDWPGFRGPQRDGRLAGVRIKTDWRQSPPKELWRRRVGPAWSSLTVVGDRLFTQEQLGPDENVVCYDAASGATVWVHRDAARFEEMMAGPGPRATPTFHAGRIYAYGASGQLNCLDAASGKPLWSHDVAGEFKVEQSAKDIPQWGFASSPLVAQGVVAVFAGARNGKTIVAYKEDTGELAWTASVGPAPEKVALSYCSPQPATVDGVEQILLATDAGLSGFEPSGGKELWHFSWPVSGTARIVQPAMLGGGDLLLGTGMSNGTRRVHVQRKGGQWLADSGWINRKFGPYFNDFVVFNGYLYGFDRSKFVCLSLKDGAEAWHARGYGSGEVLLLADQGLLLILSEEGDVALLTAQPENHTEIAKFKAIEGKTWNHPVIAHGKLFVRNDEEMACFKLELLEEPDAGRKPVAVGR